MSENEPSKDQLIMLLALTKLGRHVYTGTVPAAVKAKRRAKNRVARKSRKINRREKK